MKEKNKGVLSDRNAPSQDQITNFFTDDIIREAEDKNIYFPIDVFSPNVQDYIEQAQKRLGFHRSYSGLAILSAISTAIGGNVVMNLKAKWEVSANLWGVVVGTPTQSKTHAVSYPFNALKIENIGMHETFTEQLFEYKRKQLVKKHKTVDQSEDTDSQEEIEPKEKRIIVKDVTIEKLAMILQDNPRGVVSLQDEMSGFFTRLNRYDTNTKPDYLELWSRGYINTDRVNRESVMVSAPYFVLIGNIQYKSLIEFKRKDTSDDGFMERFLFAIPEHDEYLPSSIQDIDYDTYSAMEEMILNIYREQTTSKTIVQPSHEFKQKYNKWENEVKEYASKHTPGKRQSIVGKLTEYVLRFSLIFHIIDEDNPFEVGVQHLDKAIQLYEYFKLSAFEINDIVEGVDPLRLITGKKRLALLDLPQKFKTDAGLKIFKNHGFSSPPTFYRIVKDTNLFIKIEHGVYARRY